MNNEINSWYEVFWWGENEEGIFTDEAWFSHREQAREYMEWMLSLDWVEGASLTYYTSQLLEKKGKDL